MSRTRRLQIGGTKIVIPILLALLAIAVFTLARILLHPPVSANADTLSAQAQSVQSSLLTPTVSPTVSSTPASSPPSPIPTPGCPPAWQIVPSPNGGEPDDQNILYGVSALASDDVWAVGSSRLALAMHWDGTEWSIVPLPDTGPNYSILYAVDAVASNDVWAVGISNPDGQETLTMHWDGTEWSIIPSPNIGKPAHNFLYGVSALASDDVWAVGYYEGYSGSNSAWVPLTMHWNGEVWSIIPTPNPVLNTQNFLRSVVAIAHNDVWAVGDYSEMREGWVSRTLLMHWNGGNWNIVQSPNIGTRNNTLTSISASSSSDVWAVGSYQREGNDPSDPTRALTMHWNGDNWQPWFAPNPGVRNQLQGVVAIAEDNAWAVGIHDRQPLLEHWDGLSWNYVPGPVSSPIPYGPVLNAIDAVGGNELWGVGTDTNYGTSLTMLYPGPCVPTTPTPTPTACPIQFSDVPVGSTYYEAVRCLVCHGVASGYADGTYRPNASVTRGQLAKLVSNSAGYTENTRNQRSFQDVTQFDTFHLFIERLKGRDYVAGYPCGGSGEPCIAPSNLPYYRPGQLASRGQAAKIISDVALYNDRPTGQAFEDVPLPSTFYVQVQRLAARDIIGGYPCGGPGEPCVEPENRPYFRPASTLSRGQASQILARTFFAGCVTP
jgi:hypothetical protein